MSSFKEKLFHPTSGDEWDFEEVFETKEVWFILQSGYWMGIGKDGAEQDFWYSSAIPSLFLFEVKWAVF